jgi:hypothetical protein
MIKRRPCNAVARVEDEQQTQGCIIHTDRVDLLQHAVVVELEIARLQPADWTVVP